MTDVPKSHPRYLSLKTRDSIVSGVEKGITSIHGLIAHGRGEAFDYLMEEKTNSFALEAINVSAALLVLAKEPIVSVNGNVTALVGKDLVELGKVLDCSLEVNIFHSSKDREVKIKEVLEDYGGSVLLPDGGVLDFIDSNRKFVNKKGILVADVVFVPLEDGDRCEALQKMGKKVVTVDLNPMSRTAQMADVTIVDNVVRCLGILIDRIKEFKGKRKEELELIIKDYNNKSNLKKSLELIKK